MTLTEQVYAQAVLLSGVDAAQQEVLLEVLCQSAVTGLTQQLRDGITPEDCKADFSGGQFVCVGGTFGSGRADAGRADPDRGYDHQARRQHSCLCLPALPGRADDGPLSEGPVLLQECVICAR